MSRRDVERALRSIGATQVPNAGPHDKWRCPCGEHTAPVPRHTTISAGVVRSIGQRFPCAPKGWLA